MKIFNFHASTKLTRTFDHFKMVNLDYRTLAFIFNFQQGIFNNGKFNDFARPISEGYSDQLSIQVDPHSAFVPAIAKIKPATIFSSVE